MSKPAVRCLDTNVFIYADVVDAAPALRSAAQALREDSFRTGTVVSPGFGWTEIGTTLRRFVRARGITTAEGDCLWAHYWQLPIEFVDSPEMRSRAWQIADQFSLPTLYDATFLACAELTGAQFWTADRTLLRSLGDHRPEYVHAVEPRP